MSEINVPHIYYALEEDYCNWGSCNIEFNKNIDREILKQAVTDSLKRYPFMADKLVIRDEKYVLEKNDYPVDVYSLDEKPMYLLGPGNNYYMFRFATKGTALEARFFHGLCDGRGFMPFLKTVLLEYFNRTENRLHVVKDIDASAPEIHKKEINDQCLEKTFESSASQDVPPQQAVYQFPEERDPLGRQFSYRIELDSHQFMEFTKAADGSPNVMVTLFMTNAILSENPDASGRISVGVAIDARSIMGVTKSKHNYVVLMELNHKEKLAKMPLEMQATCYRGMIFLQSEPENVFPILRIMKQMDDMVASMPSLQKKRDVVLSVVSEHLCDRTFMVSYVGAMDYGEINQYIKSIYFSVDMKYSDMLIEVACLNDKFFINIMQNFESEKYVKAFLKQLETANIKYTYKGQEVMTTMIADCPLI